MASTQQITDCPIRRRLAHLPWVSGGHTGTHHQPGIQRGSLARLQKIHVAQPDLAAVRMDPQRL